MILGIDPGNEETALVVIDGDLFPVYAAKVANDDINQALWALVVNCGCFQAVGIECIASYGMAVGKEVFETAEWSGRIREIAKAKWTTAKILRVYRKQVTMHICLSTKANDSNIRRAILDRYPTTGGGKTPQVGTKSQPGPLFGFANDMWAALGVAITTAEKQNELTIWK